MLKILEERRDRLQQKYEQLIAREKVNPELRQSSEYLQDRSELEGQIAFYSDYELIQTADESNIRERLKELVETVWDDACMVMDDCDACLVENELDVNRCQRCSEDGEALRLLVIRDEAFDVLDVLEGKPEAVTC